MSRAPRFVISLLDPLRAARTKHQLSIFFFLFLFCISKLSKAETSHTRHCRQVIACGFVAGIMAVLKHVVVSNIVGSTQPDPPPPVAFLGGHI